MSDALRFRPVTASTLGDFEALFSARGSPSYCWCMAWRATSEELKHAKGPDRRQQIASRVKRRTPIGLLAYRDDEPVGWVSLAPKSTFRGLGGTEDQQDVWSLTCLFIPRSLRGTGLGQQLIEGAIAYARKRKARLIEAYPVDPDSPSYRHMGFVPAFERAGFTAVGREGKRRQIMHLAP